MARNYLYAIIVGIFILLNFFPFKFWHQKNKQQVSGKEQEFEKKLEEYYLTVRSVFQNYHNKMLISALAIITLTAFFVLFLKGDDKEYFFIFSCIAFVFPYLIIGGHFAKKGRVALVKTFGPIVHRVFNFLMLILFSLLTILAIVGLAYLFDLQSWLELINRYLKPMLK